MLPGLISWHLGSSLSFILLVSAFNLHDYAADSILETHPVGLSNILDSEVMQDIHRRTPMERPHRKRVAVSLVGS